MNIADFVVGLGFDTSDFEKGSRKVSTDLTGLRSDILQVGATLAGAFGGKALTIDFANTNDKLRQVAEGLGITTSALYGMNEAAKSFGAREGEMASLLSTLTSMKTRFNELGELGAFEELAKLGVDIDRLTGAKDSVSAMLALSDELAKLSTSRRFEAASVLGISMQTLDLLSNGSKSVRDLSKAYQDARPHTEAMADVSRLLIAQWNELTERVGGRADRLSTPLVAALADITGGMNDWLEANQALIDQNIDAVIKAISDNFNILAPVAVAVAGSGLASTFAGLAKSVPIVGGAMATVSASLGKVAGLAGAIGLAAELWDWDAKKLEEKTGIKLPDWVFKPIGELIDDMGTTVDERGNNAYEPIDERRNNAYEQMRNTGISSKGTTVVQREVNGRIENNIYIDGKLVTKQVVDNLNFALEESESNATSTEER